MGRCSEMLQIRENCFEEYEFKQNTPNPLSQGGKEESEYFQVFENTENILAILYHPYQIENLKKLILTTEKSVIVYIFSM